MLEVARVRVHGAREAALAEALEEDECGDRDALVEPRGEDDANVEGLEAVLPALVLLEGVWDRVAREEEGHVVRAAAGEVFLVGGGIVKGLVGCQRWELGAKRRPTSV